MKKLLLILILLFPLFIVAQSFWSLAIDDNSYNKSRTTDNALFQDSIILVSGFVIDAPCHYHQLFAYNLSGERLWNIAGHYDLIYCDSDYIYTTGYNLIGDIIGNEQIVISKYDKYGNEIFSIAYPDIPHYGYIFKPKSIDIATDGTILISSTNSILKSNINGSEIQEYEIDLESEIISIHSLNALTYIIRTDNKIYKTDDSFSITESVEFSNTINAMIIINENIYTLHDFCLLQIDSDLNISDTIVSGAQCYNNMYLYDNSFWLQANVEDSIKLYNLINLNLDKTLTFPAFVNNAEFILAQNKYTFVGNSFTDQIGIYNFEVVGDEVISVSLPDCELLDFNIDSITIEYVQLNDNDSLAIGYRFITELTIRNNGNEIINSIAIFTDLVGGSECQKNQFYHKFTALNISPGEDKTLNLEQIYQDGITNNQLCFQVLAPNSELEVLTENNSLCKTFVINKVINESSQKIQIYPNPFTDYFIIENPNLNIDYIDIIDLNGKLISRDIVTDNTAKIKTHALKSGVYILKIHAENKIRSNLIIKE